MDDHPFLALTVMGMMVAALIQDVQRVQVRKHRNGGPNDHVFHGRNGRNEGLALMAVVVQKVGNFFRFQVHVVQKHGAQLEVRMAQRALLLLLPLNAPNQLLLAQRAVFNAHPFLAHVLYRATIAHEGVHYPNGGRRLRMQQIVVQVRI